MHVGRRHFQPLNQGPLHQSPRWGSLEQTTGPGLWGQRDRTATCWRGLWPQEVTKPLWEGVFLRWGDNSNIMELVFPPEASLGLVLTQ